MVSDSGNGIYRSVFATLIGFTLVGAAPKPDSKNAGEQSQAKTEASQSPAAAPKPVGSTVPVVQGPVLERPCQERQDNRQSDLCAQWKAADAASKAAWWAAFGTIVAMIGTAGLYWQIVLTRKAVEDTGKATEAMREANQIARLGVSGNRAWLTPSGIEHAVLQDCTVAGVFIPETFGLIAKWINTGGSPAIQAMAVNDYRVVPASDASTETFVQPPPISEMNGIVGPNQTISTTMFIMSAEQAADFLSTKAVVLVSAAAYYFDVHSDGSNADNMRVTEVNYIVQHGGGMKQSGTGVPYHAIDAHLMGHGKAT